MKREKLATLLCAALAASGTIAAENLMNPLLPNVADCGVLKYNGKYYLGGCRTDGDFYITQDLVNWDGPVHVIDMKNDWCGAGAGCDNRQIHSNDMVYHNGTIHAYWSVNYWGKDAMLVHTVHSEASDPMGPYEEPDKVRWMDSRIDPKVFRDDDGGLYMYLVRFTDGNAIWGRRMKNYREFADEDLHMHFASQPGTWERMDSRVAEGPWVMKYHNLYYMMYNGNHTSTEYGNYQLGVAVADSPLGFNNGSKYSHPVALSNQRELEFDRPDLLRYTATDYTPEFSFTTTEPAKGWTAPGFDDNSWERGRGGFGSRHIEGSTSYPVATDWKSERIFLRKKFVVENAADNLALRMTHRGATRVWINGVEVYSADKGDYRILNFTEVQKKLIKKGENVIAIESAANRRGGYVNASLFDMGNSLAEPDIVWSPGQPNILRGPNGLEWWLIYMSNINDEGRNQQIDRVHFFGDKLVVDGITSAKNSGFHPVPALPRYGDTFDNAEGVGAWNGFRSAAWQIDAGEMKALQKADMTLLPEMAASSYLWEVNVNPATAGAGIIAAFKDNGNYMKIGFDSEKSELLITTVANGKRSEGRRSLYDGFRTDAYHQLRIERDGDDVVLSLDEMRQPGIISLGFSEPAIPGVYADASGVTFDGIVYTIGFDDGNDRMNNWNLLAGKLSQIGNGAIAEGKTEATKGTASKRYEFMTQVSGLGNDAVAGFYPVYVDSRNYIKAVLNAEKRVLQLATVLKGKEVGSSEIPLAVTRTLYADARFTDGYEKTFILDCPSVIDAILLPRHEVDVPEIFHDNTFGLMKMEHMLPDGSFATIAADKVSIDSHPAWNRADIAPTTVRRLCFTNKDATDGARHIYNIRVNELFKDSYNLRATREGDTLHLMVDGREICAPLDVASFKPSVVGLVSEQGTPSYSGVLYYQK